MRLQVALGGDGFLLEQLLGACKPLCDLTLTLLEALPTSDAFAHSGLPCNRSRGHFGESERGDGREWRLILIFQICFMPLGADIHVWLSGSCSRKQRRD